MIDSCWAGELLLQRAFAEIVSMSLVVTGCVEIGNDTLFAGASRPALEGKP